MGDGDKSRVPTVPAKLSSGEIKLSAVEASTAEVLLDVLGKPAWGRLLKEATLSAGGMGEIETVIDSVLQRRLARKLIHPELQARDATLKMFVREAQITGRLSHPNIVPVHEIGCNPDGQFYFTMKLIRGQTLAQIIEQRAKAAMSRNELLTLIEWMLKVCDALGYAHDNGVLHCDIKPDNIMIGDFGQVYLMDWGVAYVIDEGDEQLTEDLVGLGHRNPGGKTSNTEVDGLILGTPEFMSPEQARGPRSELDVRADVFSLGGVLYAALTRRPLYSPDSPLATLLLAQNCEVKPIHEVVGRGVVPRELERIAMRALEADPAKRQQSVGEFAEELRRFIRGDGEFQRIDVLAGETLVTEGEMGEAAYIIVSGACEAVQERNGRRTVLRTMRAGEVFGEASILSPGPRTASVVVTEDATLMVIDRIVLEEELELLKPWLAALLRTLAERFRDVDGQLREALKER